MRPVTRALAIAALPFALWACGPDGGDDEDPCTAENHCVRDGNQVSCEDGYVWEDASDADNYTCVEAEDSGDGDTGDGDSGDGDGDTGDGDGNTGDGDGDAPCTYPSYPNVLTGVGQVMPPVTITGARTANGTAFDFSFEDFYCDDFWDDYDSIVVIMFAEWCPSCPQEVIAINAERQDLYDNNALIMYWDTQTRSGYRPTSLSADIWISSHIGEQSGLRVGSLDSSDQAVLDSMSTFVPNGFVIRRSDMQVITHQETFGAGVPYVQVTGDLEADWSEDGSNGNCEEGDDEIYEPNNYLNEAPTFDGPIDFSGGLCGVGLDIYYVDIDGSWTVDLAFEHAVGNLDMYVINGNGQTLSASNSLNDNETVTYTGPAFVAVIGEDYSTAPYQFTLSLD